MNAVGPKAVVVLTAADDLGRSRAQPDRRTRQEQTMCSSSSDRWSRRPQREKKPGGRQHPGNNTHGGPSRSHSEEDQDGEGWFLGPSDGSATAERRGAAAAQSLRERPVAQANEQVSQCAEKRVFVASAACQAGGCRRRLLWVTKGCQQVTDCGCQRFISRRARPLLRQRKQAPR